MSSAAKFERGRRDKTGVYGKEITSRRSATSVTRRLNAEREAGPIAEKLFGDAIASNDTLDKLKEIY